MRSRQAGAAVPKDRSEEVINDVKQQGRNLASLQGV